MVRTGAAAAGERCGTQEANAKGDAENGKLFHD
jgi:hypothetical protein